MSGLAAEHGAVNLGQGFPDLTATRAGQGDPAPWRGLNQYPPMTGVLVLREAIAARCEAWYGPAGGRDDPVARSPSRPAPPRPSSRPSWPSCTRATRSSCWGPATTATCPTSSWPAAPWCACRWMPGNFRPDFDNIAAALTPRTRAILINTPHNPSATVWTRVDTLRLQDRWRRRRAADQRRGLRAHGVRRQEHWSIARFPVWRTRVHRLELRQDLPRHRLEGRLRGGAGGADDRVPQGAPVQRVHGQHARCSTVWPPTWPTRRPPRIAAFYQRKRDLFREGLGAHLIPPAAPRAATSSAWTSRPGVPERSLPEAEFCRWLTTEVGVAAIPLRRSTGTASTRRGALLLRQAGRDPATGAGRLSRL